jgi:SAM-dependent methyltransferase
MKLYRELARIYHGMYQQLFNYAADFHYYDDILQQFQCMNVLELGCGTGVLAKYFIDSMYSYLGVDLYEEMLQIARETAPQGHFVQGDMRTFRVHRTFDAIIINGKTFSHLLSNSDLLSCLDSISRVLKPKGLLIFDVFDANYIFSNFQEKVEDIINYDDISVKRFSTNTPNLETGWTWDWTTKYYILQNAVQRIVDDNITLRAFTKDELDLWLRYCQLTPINYEISEDNPSRLIQVAVKNRVN